MSTMYVQAAANTADRIAPAMGSGDLLDESWLVARAKSGHEEAFGELYQRHQLKSYRTALRILRHQQDAEDVVQRAFQRAFVSLEAFREDSTFSTWLTRVVINEALMLLRQRRSREPLHEGSVDAAKDEGGVEIADGGPTPEEIFFENERHATVRQAISKLRKSLRIVLLHRDVEGLTSAETAQRLGLTVSAVKARTFHARRFLKKHLERKFKTTSLSNKLQRQNTERYPVASLSRGTD
jgi:RNA polymerase sigma-70 factor, ECF subfamily